MKQQKNSGLSDANQKQSVGAVGNGLVAGENADSGTPETAGNTLFDSPSRRQLAADSRSYRDKAKLTGLSVSALRRYQLGERLPPTEEQAKIEAGLGVPASGWQDTDDPPEVAPANSFEELGRFHAGRAAAAGTNDYQWCQAAGAQFKVLVSQIDTLEREITPEQRLLAAMAYAQLRETTTGLFPSLEVLARVLPEPCITGPFAELAEVRTEVESIHREALQRASTTSRVVRDQDRTSLTGLAGHTRQALQDINELTAPRSVIESQPWLDLCGRAAKFFEGHPYERVRLIDVLAQGDELQQSLATMLRKVRHITWPCALFRDDPVGFCRVVLGLELWAGQIEILETIRDNRLVTVRSGQKCGKTLIIMAAARWWFCTRERAQVMLSNFTGNQLESQDWTQLCWLHRNSGICLDCRKAGVKQRPCPHSQVIDGTPRATSQGASNSPGGITVGDRKIFGKVSMTEEGLLGYSGAELLVIVDEASTLDQGMFDAYLGNTASKASKMLIAGNPLKITGPFHATHHRLSNIWHGVHLSAIDAAKSNIDGLASEEHIIVAEMHDDEGRDSPFFQIRVLGEFPTRDESAIYPLIDLNGMLDAERHATASRSDGPLIISIDPAGSTMNVKRDKSVFTIGRGLTVFEQRAGQGYTAAQHVEAAVEIARQYSKPGEEVILIIDADGVGAALKEVLRAYADSPKHQVKFRVIEFYFGADAIAWDRYELRGDEAHTAAQTWIRRGGVCPPSALLETELEKYQWCNVRRRRGQWETREVEVQSGTRKKDIKVLIHHSPDHADSFRMYCLAWYEMIYTPALDERAENPYKPTANEERAALEKEELAARATNPRMARMAEELGDDGSDDGSDGGYMSRLARSLGFR